MSVEIAGLAGADDELLALLSSLPFETAVVGDDDALASARIALVRGDDASALERCLAAGVPALALGGSDSAGAHSVRSRADACTWARALLAGPGHAPPDPGPLPPPVDEQRAALAAAPPRAARPLRIVHIGTYVFGETDVVHRILVALRTLGHEVATVDPRAIEGLASIGRLDGVVPIQIDVTRLIPLLDRFTPDLVMWNAGGFHPSEEGARLLSERGIAQLHLILSDPDAHETARAFAGRFDAVATNARDCVDAYTDLGVKVTRHLPFAVDHAFVVAPVPPRPDWRAEVVCVGHGRPDRQPTMRALAERFNVRVYGKNWELPAVEARDQDVVIALREGAFHVNFPRTKAGFTNVKVGVFESVAQGGVLCTGTFEEMATLFEYDREIVGYRNEEQLAATIAWLRDHPGEADEIRRRAFARLAREHLWERRLDELLDAMQIEPRDHTAARAVVIADGEKLRDAADRLADAQPGCVVRAVSTDPSRALLEHGIDALETGALFEIEDRIREADVVVFAGRLDDDAFRLGGGIPDVLDGTGEGLAAHARALMIAAIHDVPVVWHRIAAGPLETPDARVLTTFLARHTVAISAQDDASARALGSFGIDAAGGGDLRLPAPQGRGSRRSQSYPRRTSQRDQELAELGRQLAARGRRIRDLREHVKELRATAADARWRARATKGARGGLAGRLRRAVTRRLGR